MKIFTKHGTHNNPVLKIVAMVLFIVFPIVGFVLGVQYQSLLFDIKRLEDTAVLPYEKKINEVSLADSNIKTYISKKLGISFTYLLQQEFPEGREISIFENKNKVCVTYDSKDVNCTKGQYVEVFPKKTEETIEETIRRIFLTNKDPSRCFVTTYNNTEEYGKQFVKAEITFPEDKEFDLEKMYQKSVYCSEDYARTNGIRYFLMDIQHPDKLLFFSIGQYGIYGGDDIAWQETIKVL